MPDPTACPCGTGLPYDACCEPLHDRAREAVSAEALMRSRYAAYAKGREGHLTRTWHPRTRPQVVGVDPDVRWTALEVTDLVDGGVDDETGEVAFRAHWASSDGVGVLEERSSFARHRGRWVYVGAV